MTTLLEPDIVVVEEPEVRGPRCVCGLLCDDLVFVGGVLVRLCPLCEQERLDEGREEVRRAIADPERASADAWDGHSYPSRRRNRLTADPVGGIACYERLLWDALHGVKQSKANESPDQKLTWLDLLLAEMHPAVAEEIRQLREAEEVRQ